MHTITDHDRSYWKYEYDTTAGYLVPLLRSWNVRLDAARVLDIGCGDGGNLCALADAGSLCRGFDLDRGRIESARVLAGGRNCVFETGDLADQPPPFHGELFDVVFLHDVFEHLERKTDMLRILADYCTDDGRIVITFPPYYSAFGAHQQLLRSFVGRIPFIHLLPGFSILVLGRLRGEPEAFVAEIRKLVRLKMGMASFEAAARESGLTIRAVRKYIISPNHIRFGLKPAGAGVLGSVPGIRELLVSGAVYMLSK